MSEIVELIQNNDIEKLATTYFNNEKSITENRDDIILAAFKTESLIIYTLLVCYLSIDNKSAKTHYLISELLVGPLCIFTGAYLCAYYHALLSCKYSSDISYKEFLLFFNEIPDKILNDEDALLIANEILLLNPNSENALRILRR